MGGLICWFVFWVLGFSVSCDCWFCVGSHDTVSVWVCVRLISDTGVRGSVVARGLVGV